MKKEEKKKNPLIIWRKNEKGKEKRRWKDSLLYSCCCFFFPRGKSHQDKNNSFIADNSEMKRERGEQNMQIRVPIILSTFLFFPLLLPSSPLFNFTMPPSLCFSPLFTNMLIRLPIILSGFLFFPLLLPSSSLSIITLPLYPLLAVSLLHALICKS